MRQIFRCGAVPSEAWYIDPVSFAGKIISQGADLSRCRHIAVGKQHTDFAVASAQKHGKTDLFGLALSFDKESAIILLKLLFVFLKEMFCNFCF